MAPSAVALPVRGEDNLASEVRGKAPKVIRHIGIEGGKTIAKYPHYLPTWNHAQKYPPLEPFEHNERGENADPALKDLLLPRSNIKHLTPKFGSEVSGVQIRKLSNAGKDQLALLVVQRKVLAFRDQGFADLPIQEALDFGSYFGRHHIHPTTGSPEGYSEIHNVHRSPTGDPNNDENQANKAIGTAWHSDVSFEDQPLRVTFLYVLDQPEIGGDTLFADGVEAYNRLSPALQERLHGLKALHSNHKAFQRIKAEGGVIRKEPNTAEHPLTRTHPVTGEKALYVHGGFIERIVGLKIEESDALIKFLLDHVEGGPDIHARVLWKPKTVVVWDNRVTSHTAIFDWSSPAERRHLARITLQAERPYETPYVIGDAESLT